MCFGGGGGGGQQTVVQKNEIPQYLQDFSQENIGVAKSIADRPYPVYGGQRVADPSNLTTGAQNLQNQMSQNYWNQGFNEFQQPINTLLNSMVNNQYGQPVPGAIQSAANASAGTYGQPVPGVQQAGAGSYGGALPGVQQTNAGSYGGFLPGVQTVGANTFGQSMNPWSIAPWMSPFVQQALDPQLREISRQGAAQGRTIQNQAAGAGAFGDARTGVEMGENTRNTAQLRSDATAQGYQSAYDRAVSAAQNAFGMNAGQFNTEEAARRAAAAQNNAALLQQYQTGAGQFNTEDAARRASAIANNQANLAQYQAGAGQFNTEDAARRAAAAQNNQYNLAQYQAGAGQFNTEDAARRAATTANAQINALNNAANLDVYKTGAGQFNAERAAQLAAAAGAQNAVLGQQQYGSNLAQQLYAGGTLDEQNRQKSLDLAYQDFINQFEYPQEMLNLRLATGQGVPYSTTRLTTTPYSATGQAIGSLAALYGLFGRPAGNTGATASNALGGLFG